MAAYDTLASLRLIDEPNRKVDVAIAVDVGYFAREVTDENGVSAQYWFDPSGKQLRRVPPFTHRLTDAIALAELAYPTHVGALAWERGKPYRVQIEGGDIAYGPSAAIAMCIAVFELLTAKR